MPLFHYFSILCRFFCEREPSSQGGRLLVGLVGYPTRKVWKKHKRKRPSRSQLGGSLRSLPPPPPPSPSPPLPSPSSPPPLAAALAAALATTPRRWSRRSSSFASCWCVRRMSPWQCERQAVRFAVLAPVWLDWGGFFECSQAVGRYGSRRRQGTAVVRVLCAMIAMFCVCLHLRWLLATDGGHSCVRMLARCMASVSQFEFRLI